MKRWSTLYAICMVVLLAGLWATDSAIAESAPQMTALEKKLYEAAKKEGKVFWWDSQSLKEASLFINAFTKRYPGVDVSFWEGNSYQVDEKYFAERQGGRNPVDVMQIEWYDKYKKEGLLTDLGDIVKDSGFSREFTTKEGDAVSIEHTIRGVAYNTKLVSPKDSLRSWEDLLNPKWKNKIAVETNMSVFVSLTPSWGEEKIIAYLKKLAEQKPIFTEGVTHLMTLLGAGEFPIAVNVLLHRTLDMQSKGTPVAWMPISPIVDRFAPYVIARDAPHPNAAKLYVRWLMSPEGQSLVDKVRKKGNPLPGSGTIQAKAVEQLGIKVTVVQHWGLDFKRLEDIYRKAAGGR